ncbi:unnamed protein product [Rotaria magnacalcarata]
MSNARDLKAFYGHPNFRQSWNRIGTNIIIRRVHNIDDIPKFQELSNKFQNVIKSNMNASNNVCQIVSDQSYFYNCYAILLRNETDKWIGIYKFVNLSPHIPALFVSIGIGIGSFYLIWNFLPKWNDHVVDLEHSSSTLTSNVSNNAIKYVKLSNNNKFSFRRSIFGIIFTTITTAIDFIFLENGSKTVIQNIMN